MPTMIADSETGWWRDENGNPIQRLFTEVYDENRHIRVKTTLPVIRDIVSLESRRWRAIQYRTRWHKEKFIPAFDALFEVGNAHVKVSHKHTGTKKWWLYSTKDNGSPYGKAYSFKWVDEPENPQNTEIGQCFYALDRFSSNIYNRVEKFNIVLNRAFEVILHGPHFNERPDKEGVTRRYVINGRHYYYRSCFNSHGILTWKKLLWPENDLEEIVL